MKICLVTTFPPSQGGLNEYGLHIAQELRRNPFLSLTILADEISSPLPELEGFSIKRCWSFDDPQSAIRLMRVIGKLRPDVVWFNLLFSTFGRKPLNAFLGLLTPLLARLSGRYTHVTLHHLMDTVDLADAGVRHKRAYRWAGSVATRMLLLANSVSVLMPGYRKILLDKYGHDNVYLRSHGILSRRPEYPQFPRRGNPEHRILAFGKWGTYKRLELMIEAFQSISAAMPLAKLVIAGGDHPQARGYVESMKTRYAGPMVEFTGYVNEQNLPDLFQQSSVAVMPYSSSTGCSGVAHLACAYGVPIVCADLPDFRQMADGEDLALEFYKAGSAEDLANSLTALLKDPEKQQSMALHNFTRALRMTMPMIVQKYLRNFELEQRTEVLRQVTRFRRLPGWVPSRSLLLRLMTRNSQRWVHRSAVQHPVQGVSGRQLIDNDVDGSRKITGAGVPGNGNGVGRLAGGAVYAIAAHTLAVSSAGNRDHSHGENGAEDQHPRAPAPDAAGQQQPGQTEGQQTKSKEWIRLPVRSVAGGSGNGRDGEHGGGASRSGADGGGGK